MKTTGITFKDIIKEIYQDSTMSVDVNQNSISSDKYDDLDNFNNFYKQKQKEFNDILETLNLADYSNLLKQSGQYRFNSKDKDFVKEILSEYTKKLEPLRRADYNNADPDFIIKLHDGFITLFQNLEVSDEQLNEIGNSLSNRIKYLRKLMESKTRLIEAKNK
jgi:chaperonin cofactor prefoldin